MTRHSARGHAEARLVSRPSFLNLTPLQGMPRSERSQMWHAGEVPAHYLNRYLMLTVSPACSLMRFLYGARLSLRISTECSPGASANASSGGDVPQCLPSM